MVGDHRSRRRRTAALAAIAALCALGGTARACGGADLGEARVVAIPHPNTLTLDDGRTIRLAGLAWRKDPSGEIRTALATATRNRTVALKGTAAPDRYGRQHALVFVGGAQTPVQYELLERGLAVANLHAGGKSIDDRTCAQAMLMREQRAREAGRGIWSRDPVMSAERPADILKAHGQFSVVQGRVISVRDFGNTTYVNFGRRWSEDFTVTIAKRQHSAFISGGLTPQSLSGRVVRVRGTIEERAGPWIEATAPAQFEFVTAGAASR